MKFSLVIHPLSVIFVGILLLCGYFNAIFCYLITIILHELAHAFVAYKLGYKLNKIKLMPYGASLSGNSSFFCAKDGVLIALAGPVLNFILVILGLALWWIEPITYVYTVDFVMANLAVGLTNCLPVFPLDGGRVLFCLLNERVGLKKTSVIVKFLGVSLSMVIVVGFVITVFFIPNYTMLIFGAFLFVSSIIEDKSSFYLSIGLLESKTNVAAGLKVREYAVLQTIPLYKLFTFIRRDSITNFCVVDKDLTPIGKISENQLESLIRIYPSSVKVEKIMRK